MLVLEAAISREVALVRSTTWSLSGLLAAAGAAGTGGAAGAAGAGAEACVAAAAAAPPTGPLFRNSLNLQTSQKCLSNKNS